MHFNAKGISNRLKRTGRALLLNAAIACLPGMSGIGAAAQDAPPPGTVTNRALEEVVTTARRKEESLQTVPVASTAVPKIVLEQYDIKGIEQISDITPNLTVSNGSNGVGPAILIRGIGTRGSSAGFDPAVGIVIDGVFYGRTRFLQQAYLDMERVEVMKGPQALYFGKNNSAGLISIETSNPGDDFEAYVKTSYEFETEEITTEGVVSGPISDTFGIRLAVRYNTMNGWMRNDRQLRPGADPLGFDIPAAPRKHEPGTDEITGRLTLKWTPSDELSSIFKIQLDRNTSTMRTIGMQIMDCPQGQPQKVFGVTDPGSDCKLNSTVDYGLAPPELFVDEPEEFRGGKLFGVYRSVAGSWNTNYDGEQVSLTSITGYAHYHNEFSTAGAQDGTGQVPVYEETSYGAFSQEIRARTQFDWPVNFLIGLYYQSTDLDVRNSSRIRSLPADSATGRYFTWDKFSNTKGETWSAFGEATWNITETLELAGGARYTLEKKRFLYEPTYIHEFFINAGAFTYNKLNGTFKDNNVSPQATLTWRPTDDLTFYGAYKTGYKSGGFDASHIPSVGRTIDTLEYQSEKAKGFEIGAKTEWFDQLRFNVVAYTYNFSNLQVQQFDPLAIVFRIGNAAKARTQGVEADFVWAPTSDFSLHGGVSYNDPRYRKYRASCYTGQTVEAGCTESINPSSGLPTETDRAGKRLSQSSPWELQLGASKDFRLSSDWGLTVTADASYSDAYYINDIGRPNSIQDSFVLLDASARVYQESNGLEISFIGRNLLNTSVATYGVERAFTGGGTGRPASAGLSFLSDFVGFSKRGREIILQVTYRFN